MQRSLRSVCVLLPLATTGFAQESHCSERVLEATTNTNSTFPWRMVVEGEVALLTDRVFNSFSRVHAFERRADGTWEHLQLIESPFVTTTQRFGHGLALQGDVAFIGDPGWQSASLVDRGRLHQLQRDPVTGMWSEVTSFLGPPGRAFGEELALDGEWLAVQAFTGQWVPRVHIYRRSALGDWNLHTTLNHHGRLALDGERLLVGEVGDDTLAQNAGRAFLYEHSDAAGWTLSEVFDPPQPVVGGLFGAGRFADGQLVIKSAATSSGASRMHVFRQDPVTLAWSLAQELELADFPSAFSDQIEAFDLDGDLLALGDPDWSPTGQFGHQMGRIVTYRRDALGVWQTTDSLEHPVTGYTTERLGWKVAAGGGTLAYAGLATSGAWGVALDPIDCNGNSIADVCDVFEGAVDVNGDLALDQCQLVGTSYCGPAVVNSTGVVARLKGLGSAVAGAVALELCVEGQPAGAFGYLLASPLQDFIAMPGNSEGNLCLAGGPGFGRYTDQVRAADALGRTCVDVDLGAVPTAGAPVALVAGDTWNFQYWYRDGVTSNFTAGLEITAQ